jgi:hypothetical protein
LESFHVVLQTIMIVERKQVWAKERQGGCLKNFDEKFASNYDFFPEISEKGHFWHNSSLEIHKFSLNSRITSPYLCESVKIFVKISF